MIKITNREDELTDDNATAAIESISCIMYGDYRLYKNPTPGEPLRFTVTKIRDCCNEELLAKFTRLSHAMSFAGAILSKEREQTRRLDEWQQ